MFTGALAWLLEAAEELEERWCLLMHGPLLQTHGQTVSYHTLILHFIRIEGYIANSWVALCGSAFHTTVVVASDALHTECRHYVSLNLM